MFIEPHIRTNKLGWVEVICGSMFSGKTEELIRRLKRAKIANQKVEIFKPAIDDRYDKEKLVSHDENRIQSFSVNSSVDILNATNGSEVVGIDEAQFFDEGIVDACQQMALEGKRVIVAGLDMDFECKPFGPMANLLAIADYITKVHAICVVCGNLANYSFRKIWDKEQILIGELDKYEPRCRACYKEGVAEMKESSKETESK